MNNKKTKIAAASFSIILILAAGFCVYANFITKETKQQSGAEVYTCPMHPQIISDRPGSCPICGMDLVKKNIDNTDDNHTTHEMDSTGINQVKLSPSEQVLANVQTVEAKTMVFQGEKTYNGYVKINEKGFAHISTAISGKIT